MTPEQKDTLISEISAAGTRMDEILDSIKARKGALYARAADFVVTTTVALALHDALLRRASPEFTHVSSLLLDDIGPGVLELATLLAYASKGLTAGSPEFRGCVREFSAELSPLIAERQRIQNRTQTIMEAHND